MQMNIGRTLRILCGLLTCVLFFSACSPLRQERESEEKERPVEETTEEKVVPGAGKTVTIRSIGDILLHDAVYWDGQTEEGYYFDSMFEPVAKYVGEADITTANMETIVAGSVLGVSSYPIFNAPEQIVDTLLNLGVDIVSNATNHTVDYGGAGAHASIETLKTKGMQYVGSYESWEDYHQPRIIEVDGIKVGFLNYTYGTNGNPIPEDEPYLATLIDTELIPQEIQALNEKVDISIVIYHYGEDSMVPVQSQLDLTDLAIEAGANFVLGGHSHIMQPMERFSDSQGAWYSHGNFLSGQVQEYEKIGGIGEYTFKKHEDGSVTLEEMRLMPTYNFGLPEWDTYLVVPLTEAQDYGLWNGDALYNEVYERFTTYSDSVEVVEYFE
ncbi:CapA family protein [Facklamia lactis]|nr:CapA family protein [Facklamia lactis]